MTWILVEVDDPHDVGINEKRRLILEDTEIGQDTQGFSVLRLVTDCHEVHPATFVKSQIVDGADLGALAIRVSDAETATPAAAIELREAWRCILRAQRKLENTKHDGGIESDASPSIEIWVCEICNAVHNIADVDPAWAAHGCPECHDKGGDVE